MSKLTNHRTKATIQESTTNLPLLSKDGSVHVTNEVINTITHLVAACLAILGASLLIIKAVLTGNVWLIVGVSIYSASLISLFVFSTLHHGYNGSPKTNSTLRTLDYLAVFFLIAGTVTPLVLQVYKNPFGWAVFGVVWFIAIFGMIIRSVFPSIPKYVTSTLYIILGWIPVVLVFNKPALPFEALVLLALGGIIYSIGFIVFIVEKPNLIKGWFGFHEIWHILVAVAAIIHFFFIYLFIA